jgi:hypothetical protein
LRDGAGDVLVGIFEGRVRMYKSSVLETLSYFVGQCAGDLEVCGTGGGFVVQRSF